LEDVINKEQFLERYKESKFYLDSDFNLNK